MKYLTFTDVERSFYKTCFLVPKLHKKEIVDNYLKPYLKNYEDVLAYDLFQTGKRTSVKNQKEYLDEILPILQDLQVKYLVVSDGDYFKTLTKTTKVEPHLGYVMDCIVGDFKVIYIPNFAMMFYDPEKTKAKIDQAMTALVNHQKGTYQDPGQDIIHLAAYPKTYVEIKTWLQRLLDMDVDLSSDIEGFGLKHYDAGIGTITFCWNQHEGIAFPVDYVSETWIDAEDKLHYGVQKKNEPVRDLLRSFFKAMKRKIRWHNAGYDLYVLIYQLFMDDVLDTAGLLDGLEIMTRHFDDTMIITYLATNSCAGNKLGLKDQSQEFAGNYAQTDIDDITKIPLDDLLRYNLVDGLSTNYVYDKHYQTMVDDQQLDLYENDFKAYLVDIIQMQLTGMPLDMAEVANAKAIMQVDSDNAVNRLLGNPVVQAFIYQEMEEWVNMKNNTLKVKRVTIADAMMKVEFNPNSDQQLQRLLYGTLDFPVLDYTDSKQPATGGKTLKKLLNHVKKPEYVDLLEALVDFKAVNKILTAFIPAFERAYLAPDGHHYLFGNFKLGGTVSGRLSSNSPNLQNLPATGSKYKKVIKRCFKAPEGWLFCGLDFASLEDRISALTTKDPEKLKVYTDGYDGHCLRAYAYFGEKMPDIDPNSVDSINSIAKLYEHDRFLSKAPTFALTYQGTYITLMNNCGFSEAMARQIEDRYHKLYVVSDKYIADRIDQAGKDGYATVAFGLRVRTPLLKQVVLGTKSTPFEAAAEGRTVGNAMGQSYGLLNSRANREFMDKVRASKYRLMIRPSAQIHDAGYYLIRNDLDALLFANEHLVKAAQWQGLPEIWHDEVKLGGELSIFYPSWAEECSLPNGATEEVIVAKSEEHLAKLSEGK